MSVEEKVLNIFKDNAHRYITYSEIRSHFAPNERGVNSIDRFKRFLVQHKWDIKKRTLRKPHIRIPAYGKEGGVI